MFITRNKTITFNGACHYLSMQKSNVPSINPFKVNTGTITEATTIHQMLDSPMSLIDVKLHQCIILF